MTTLQIILIIVGVYLVAAIIYTIMGVREYFKTLKEEGTKETYLLWIGPFAPLIILVVCVFYPLKYIWQALMWLIDTLSEMKRAGGPRGYASQKRVTKEYKQGKIARHEVPRTLDGITQFELTDSNISISNLCVYKEFYHIHETTLLLYVENKFDERLNDFFSTRNITRLNHNIRFLYLPNIIKAVGNDDLVEYCIPGTKDVLQSDENVTIGFVKKLLIYSDDINNLKPGVLSFDSSYRYNDFDATYFTSDYYPLYDKREDEIIPFLNQIADKIYEHKHLGWFCTRKPADDLPESDKRFQEIVSNPDVMELVDDVKDKIQQLRKYGINSTMLKALFNQEEQLSRLVVTKDYRILLPDFNNMEIQMEPLNKAVYLLFLKHPEGIRFKNLPDYRKELAQIYQRLRPYGLTERARKSIDDVTDPTLNSINEKCARIRAAFMSKFADDIAKHYYIYGYCGMVKKIDLPEDLICWES